jgi:4-diphosphocytidyl-2C-methyl-D-erythritol kinase
MSGSGGAVFGLYDDAQSAQAAAARVGARAVDSTVQALVTTTLEELREALFPTV